MNKIETPNKTLGRQGHEIKFFIIHMTEGSEKSAINWIKDPISQVSYHYLINEKGEITKFVDTKDIAWHAGKVVNSKWEGLKNGPNPNYYSIGIACTGFAKEGPTFKQFIKTAHLIKILSKALDIEIDENTIIKHNQIRTDKTCPGEKFDRATLIKLCNLR
jgi:N-acetylmuramoyl-L-alanine amidase